jgi:O-antigen ligase
VRLLFNTYFILLGIIGFIPVYSDPIPIDTKGFHWFVWGIINSFYLILIFLNSNKKRLEFPRSPVLLSFTIFFFVSCISTINAINSVESLVRLTDLYVVLSSLIIIYFFVKNRLINLNLLLWIVFFKLLIENIAVYYQLYYYTLGFEVEFDSNFTQYLKSFYGNKNVTAFALLIQSTLAMVLFSRSNSRVLKIFILLTVQSSVYIQYFISSRAVLLSLPLIIITIIIFFLLKYFVNKSFPVEEFKKVSVYIIIILFSYLIFTSTNTNNNIDVEDRAISVTDFGGESVNNRLRFWSQSIESIRKNPILGVGIGNWKIESIKYDAKNIYSYVIPYSTHNDFIEIFAETGILGFTPYLCFFFLLIRRSINNLLIWSQSKLNYYHIYMFICLLLFIIDINLNFPLSRPLMQIVLVLFIATFESLNNEE